MKSCPSGSSQTLRPCRTSKKKRGISAQASVRKRDGRIKTQRINQRIELPGYYSWPAKNLLMPATAWLNSSYPRRFLHSLACSSRPSTAPTFVACTSNRLLPLCGEAEGDHLSRLLGVTVGQSEIPVRWPVAPRKWVESIPTGALVWESSRGVDWTAR